MLTIDLNSCTYSKNPIKKASMMKPKVLALGLIPPALYCLLLYCSVALYKGFAFSVIFA